MEKDMQEFFEFNVAGTYNRDIFCSTDIICSDDITCCLDLGGE